VILGLHGYVTELVLSILSSEIGNLYLISLCYVTPVTGHKAYTGKEEEEGYLISSHISIKFISKLYNSIHLYLNIRCPQTSVIVSVFAHVPSLSQVDQGTPQLKRTVVLGVSEGSDSIPAASFHANCECNLLCTVIAC
jgi:hypothetical protein